MIKTLVFLPFLMVSVTVGVYLSYIVYEKMKEVRNKTNIDEIAKKLSEFSVYNYLTEFEREMLKEMDDVSKWKLSECTLTHASGFRYWVANMWLIDFAPHNGFSEIRTLEFSSSIAKLLLWKKYQFCLRLL